MNKIIKVIFAAAALASLALGQVPIVPPNTFLISAVDPATSAASSTVTIVNDTTTNATMFPTWVTTTSGNLPLKVSSTKLSFNPSTGNLTAAGSLTFGSSASILNGTTGSIGLTATGTNQNITLTPTGTGQVVANGDRVFSTNNGGATWNFGASSNDFLWTESGVATWLKLTRTTGHLLVGGQTADGTGTIQLPTGSSDAASGIGFRAGAANNHLFSNGANALQYNGNTFTAGTAGGASIAIGQSGGSGIATVFDGSGNAQFSVTGAAGKVTTYGGITTAGNGVVSVYAAARATAQTGANASVATYTLGAADASFEVSANVLVTTATTHAFTCTCAYTDEGNTARTITLTFSNVGGTLLTSIANTGGAVPYEGIPLHIRAKASTAITIATTGTFTSVVYNVEGVIRKLQ